MTSAELLIYLKSQKWFFGVRTDASLLFYSTKQAGVRRYVKELQGIDFAETMLVSISGQPVRAINAEQAKAFHEISLKRVTENPKILEKLIKQNDELWLHIKNECEVLDQAVKSGEETAAISALKQTIDSYSLHGAHFITIFSLGLKLTELSATSLKRTGLATHDAWRNTLALKEELMGESWYNFFAFIAERRKVETSAKDLMRYVSLPEILIWLDDEKFEVDALAELRKIQGFVYLDLLQDCRVIDDAGLIKAISTQFSELEEQGMSDDAIQGQVAYAGAGHLKGEVVVVKNKDELAAKGSTIAGKILVTIQTTPHFIPYLKEAKAIITDEGGITCHAAIIARELQKPCIIGTKNATKVLKDGDEVEVDAENGTVKILKRIG